MSRGNRARAVELIRNALASQYGMAVHEADALIADAAAENIYTMLREEVDRQATEAIATAREAVAALGASGGQITYSDIREWMEDQGREPDFRLIATVEGWHSDGTLDLASADEYDAFRRILRDEGII